MKEWLGLSRQEMKGFVLAMLLMTIVLSLPYVIKSFQEVATYDKRRDEAALDSLVAQLQKTNQASSQETALTIQDYLPKGEPFALKPFDPNQLTAKEWEALGLKPYLAERIVKYRTKVAPFRIKSDLLKVYGFSEKLYNRFAPFILLPENIEPSSMAKNPSKPKTEENTPTKPKLQKFDLNLADSAQLVALQGVGAVLAMRIIRFREALGGFYSLEQLKEVYGITDQALQSLTTWAEITPNSHRRIPINRAEVETLKRHPYISPKLAQVIVNYRQQHGDYKNAADLQKIRILQPATLEKLLPYIEF
ncbi:MAG: helix-hairpin-helix domain-containing protein [Cytophagales bacterium]|nr:helix-hairpin-helix domain-containing protein [Bernardetiaceae bacterium]MDW8210079.1 helix-hairpin-helix domain-containing protein [Cytophagales bacterium]